MLRDLTHAYLSVINLYPMGFHIPTNAICTNADQVIDEQLSFLIELGHRRIAYLHNVEDHRPHRDLLLRREAFYRQAMESGVELHRGYVRFAGFFEASQIQAARALLATCGRLVTTVGKPEGAITRQSEAGILSSRPESFTLCLLLPRTR